MLLVKFLDVKVLNTLGFFVLNNQRSLLGTCDFSYKKYIGFFDRNRASIGLNSFGYVKVLKKLNKYFDKYLSVDCLFIFVCLSKKLFGISDLYKYLQTKVNIYFVFDWIFGAVSNHKRAYMAYDMREKKTINMVPDIAVLLQVKGWAKIIITELRNNHVFCFGITKPEFYKFIDFPLSLPNSYESNYLITCFFLHSLKNSIFDKLYKFLINV